MLFKLETINFGIRYHKAQRKMSTHTSEVYEHSSYGTGSDESILVWTLSPGQSD